ncbi:YMGG-like glycine zipper-containing protein [Deferrisoma palaeochoriense]
MRRMRVTAVVLAAVLAVACSRYEQKPLPVRVPAAYPNATTVFGVNLAAEAHADPARAKELFGFDIVGAGVLPVQVVFDHQGADPVEIVPEQTFLMDAQGQLWNVLDQRLAYKRIQDKTEWGEIAPEAGKGALLGAAAGAIVGAAIGIVTGKSVPEAAGKGAAVGGAGGAVLGGAKGHQDPEVGRSIREDLRNRSLENKPIEPGTLSHGVLFFPAEAKTPRQLRLRIRNTRTGEAQTVILSL